jgi:hypothetical protein
MGHFLPNSIAKREDGTFIILDSHLIKIPEPDFSMPFNVFCYNLSLYTVLLVTLAKKFI